MIVFLLRLRRCAFIVAVASTAANAQSPALSRDSAVFAVLVRSLVADSEMRRAYPLQVDTTQIIDANSPVSDSGVFAPSPTEIAKMRGNTLQLIGVSVGDATRPRSCGGIMIPYSPTTFHAGCPKQWRLVASIGLPRDSTAGPEPARKQLIAVRVAVTEIGPGGFSVLYLTYALELVESNWKVVGRRLDRFVE